MKQRVIRRANSAITAGAFAALAVCLSPVAFSIPQAPKAKGSKLITAPAANTVRGIVKDRLGKPVSDVTVDIVGTATQNAGIVSYEPVSAASGRYQQTDLTPGSYKVSAWKTVRYNGKTYRLPLSPVQGKIEDEYLSRKGIVRDFVWNISGPIPSKFFDPDEPNFYYGGCLKIYGTDDQSSFVDLPEGTIVKGCLVPDGPLIDGNPGKEIVFDFPFKRKELYETIQKDIPLGRYTLTLEATLPDGSTKTIRLYDGDGHEDSDFKTARTVDFLPSGAAMRPFQSHFVTTTGVSIKL